jgi:hypothetical protein
MLILAVGVANAVGVHWLGQSKVTTVAPKTERVLWCEGVVAVMLCTAHVVVVPLIFSPLTTPLQLLTVLLADHSSWLSWLFRAGLHALRLYSIAFLAVPFLRAAWLVCLNKQVCSQEQHSLYSLSRRVP